MAIHPQHKGQTGRSRDAYHAVCAANRVGQLLEFCVCISTEISAHMLLTTW